jgi:hypothetical protein
MSRTHESMKHHQTRYFQKVVEKGTWNFKRPRQLQEIEGHYPAISDDGKSGRIWEFPGVQGALGMEYPEDFASKAHIVDLSRNIRAHKVFHSNGRSGQRYQKPAGCCYQQTTIDYEQF